MLRYPASAQSQQGLLAPLTSLISQVPACEKWISFLSTVNAVYPSLTSGALQNLSDIAKSLANVFDFLYSANAQSVYSSQYLLKLSITARQTASSAVLVAPLSTGTIDIVFTQSAQSALQTLKAWDPAQGFQAPSNPGSLATALMEGVSLR